MSIFLPHIAMPLLLRRPGWSRTDYAASAGGTPPVLSNRLRTLVGGSTIDTIRATTPQTAGKLYWEAKIDAYGSGTYANGPLEVGFAVTGVGLPAAAGNVWLIVEGAANAAAYRSGIYSDFLGVTLATGDVLMFAVDFAVGFWYGRNGSWLAGNPAAGTGYTWAAGGFGAGIKPYAQIDAGSTGQQITGRWQAADLQYAPPSGFSAWGGP